MTLAAQLGGPTGDILGVQLLLGGGAADPGRREPLRRLQTRMQQPGALREALQRRRAEDFHAMVVLAEPLLLAALGRRRRDDLPAPLPLAPNLRGFMREAVEHGMIGAGIRRVWRSGPVSLVGLGMRALGQLGPLARSEFPTFLRMFTDLELASFARHDPQVVFLQPQMTDLAVAMNNPRLIEAFARAVADRTGARPGLATENFGAASSALKAWGIEVAAMIAPWDAAGSNMRPSVDVCVRSARACDFPIWADRLGMGDPPAEEDRELMKKAGLTGAVRDDHALWADAMGA